MVLGPAHVSIRIGAARSPRGNGNTAKEMKNNGHQYKEHQATRAQGISRHSTVTFIRAPPSKR